MRAIVLGYQDVGCAGLEALLRAGDDVTAVYTHRDDPAENTWFGSVAELAADNGTPVYYPEDINESRWVDRIREQRPDVIFSFYYRRLVCSELLSIPRLGAMNLHGSYLPHFRGRCPVNWVLVRGETGTGVTLHYMVQRADAGDIVAQRPIPITFEDTALTLHRKIVREGSAMLSEMLPSIRKGRNPRRPQRLEDGSYHGRRRPRDGTIDWSRPAVEIYNLVRAVTHPFPGARTSYSGRRLLIWQALPRSLPTEVARPGTVSLADGLRVATGCGALQVLTCQLEGEPELAAAEFAAAYGLRDGVILR